MENAPNDDHMFHTNTSKVYNTSNYILAAYHELRNFSKQYYK